MIKKQHRVHFQGIARSLAPHVPKPRVVESGDVTYYTLRLPVTGTGCHLRTYKVKTLSQMTREQWVGSIGEWLLLVRVP